MSASFSSRTAASKNPTSTVPALAQRDGNAPVTVFGSRRTLAGSPAQGCRHCSGPDDADLNGRRRYTGARSGKAETPGGTKGTSQVVEKPPLRRYHGTVTLDPARVGRDASRIADEVIAHLAALVGADVRVTLEIEAEIPSGAPENVVRTVTENGRTLKFSSQGFEQE